MSVPETILVPTDFGEAAELALDRAVEIAAAVNARIILMYACPPPYLTALEGAMVPTIGIVEAMSDAGRKRLANSIERKKDANVDIQSRLLVGDARVCILDAVKEFGADMIVMGTHGRRG
ncbi:MAG: universal stress protein, partial [Polyangiaceae bacterium]